jgi:hypothetical protein
MAKTPKRRARAQKQAAAPAAPIALTDVLTPAPPQPANPDDPEPRRRRKKLGMAAFRLTAPERPGFTRRFFNDDANRIAQAHELGYDPVSETRAKTPGLGSHDSRLVGTKATGEPLRAILMETPNELYAEGLAEKEAHASAIDQAIMSGRDSEGQISQIPHDEMYGQVSMKRDG